MENKHVIPALQETLADLSPEEQAVKTVLFTEKLEKLDKLADGSTSNNVRYGQEDIAGSEIQREDGHQEAGKRTHTALILVILVVCLLALIEACVIVSLLANRNGEPTNPDNSDGVSIESESGDVESFDTERGDADESTNKFEPITGSTVKSDADTGTGADATASADVGTGADAEAGADTGTDADAEAGADTGTGADAEAGAGTGAGADAAARTDPAVETDTKS